MTKIITLAIIVFAIFNMTKHKKAAIATGLMALLGFIAQGIGNFLNTRVAFMTHTTFNVIVVVFILSVIVFVVKSQIEKSTTKESPNTIVILAEAFKDVIDGLVASTMGKNHLEFAPYMLTLFAFLIVSNLLGLIGLDSPTANYSITLALALVTFFMSQYFGIKTSGIGGHIKGYFEPFVLLSPLNIIGDLADPVSLSFRLFGNIMAGGLIFTLINSAVGDLIMVIAPPLQIYFDIFSGILQAFIFTMLTMVFVGGNLD